MVSNLGRVVSCLRGQPRALNPTLTNRGYLQLQLRVAGRAVNRRVHALVAEAFLGPRPDGMEVRHLNGQGNDNCLTNLAYGTPTENMRDQVEHGSHANARKTHCPNEHPYDEVNTYHYRGMRMCRTCKRERQLRAA